MKKALILLTLTALLLAIALPMAADEAMPASGKKFNVNIYREARIGAMTLKPGDYVLEHLMKGDQHFIRFIAMRGSNVTTVGEAQCKMELSKTKFTETAVYMSEEVGVNRITRIEIRGQQYAHVF